MPRLTLENKSLRLVLDPDVGGSIARFDWLGDGDPVPLLRPATEDASDALDMASFPLVPFSNRIRDGRFDFEGQAVALPPNMGDHPHAIHGFGWQQPWEVSSKSETSISLQFNHRAAVWPWDFWAEQTFQLSETQLSVRLALVNKSDKPMPAGIGFHPYFPRPKGTKLMMPLSQWWRAEQDCLPVERADLPEDRCFDPARDVDEIDLDDCFEADGNYFDVICPDRPGLRVEAGPRLDYRVIFTPENDDFFCAEPVSHANDAFNLAQQGFENTGARYLAPGESLVGSMRFKLQA